MFPDYLSVSYDYEEIKQITQMYIKEQGAKYRSLRNTKDYIVPGAIRFINFDLLFPINETGMNDYFKTICFQFIYNKIMPDITKHFRCVSQ